MEKHYKHSVEDIKNAIASSETWADTCRKLGIPPMTGSQTHLKNRAIQAGINFEHFVGQAWNRGRTFGPKRPISDYLKLDGAFIKSHTLRLRLIKEGIKKFECELCGNSKWQGGVIPLELDHKNGNNRDNRLENLRILCCNCHAQTDNYSGKKLRGHSKTVKRGS